MNPHSVMGCDTIVGPEIPHNRLRCTKPYENI